MKIIFSTLLVFCSLAVNAQNNRGLIFNKDLKILVGNWEGTVVYTDPKKNNAQVILKTRIQVTDLTDSLKLNFIYTDPDKNETRDSSILRIYDKEDKIRIDNELFDIASTRRGPRMEVVAEREGYDNFQETGFDPRFKADFRQVITFGPANLNIVKEMKYSANEFYFIRSRSAFTKK
jgi:hypothetical protein